MSDDDPCERIGRKWYEGNDEADEPADEEIRLNVPDRFEKGVKTTHATNKVLHDVLREVDSVDNTNLMENTCEPGQTVDRRGKYYVLVEFRHEGMGHPTILDPVKRMIERDSVRLLDVVECSEDHLIVKLRPVETTVKPVTVTRAEIPDHVTGIDEDRLAAVMGEAWKAIKSTVDNSETPTAALKRFYEVLDTYDIPENAYDFDLNDDHDPRTGMLKRNMSDEELRRTERIVSWMKEKRGFG